MLFRSTRVTLELGGKSPTIVMPDANLQEAAAGAATAIFFNQGQVCCAGSRLYVHRKHFDNVVADIAGIANGMKLGNGLEVPMPKAFFAYSAIRDWDATSSDPAGKYYEERGINEFNVAISATTSAEVNDKAQKADPLIEKGVIEAIIPTLILPQASTSPGKP
mgnify:CR=1 FL=1